MYIAHTEFRYVDARDHGTRVGDLRYLSAGLQGSSEEIMHPGCYQNTRERVLDLKMGDLLIQRAVALRRLLALVLRWSNIFVAQFGKTESIRQDGKISPGAGGRGFQFKVAKPKQRSFCGHALSFVCEDLHD